MLWQIGIDEAGYGPNLGPFVMTLVACRVPEEGDLWQLLKAGVRRADDEPDHRLVIADSKQVYAPARGLTNLERTVLAASPWLADQVESTLHASIGCLLDCLSCEPLAVLRQEAWFVGDTPLPTAAALEELNAARMLWRASCAAANVTWGFCRSAIVPAPRFNDLVDQWHSKAAVLSVAVTDLMRRCLEATPPEPMRFVIDKHGGRNTYSALLQHAFQEGIVFAESEGRERSVYRVEGLDRPVQIVVTPKADVEHFTVALASMVSKYVRELLMLEFNRFWRLHLPDLEPTAGYPGDSQRYFDAIRPIMQKLGIADRLVWRCR